MSLIFKTTTTDQEVLANGIIPLTTITRRLGRNIQSSGDNVLLLAPGYYSVNVGITFTAETAGDVTINLQVNGIDSPGFTATETITTATTEVRTVTLSGILRVFCNNSSASLTLVNASEVGITVSNVAITVTD